MKETYLVSVDRSRSCLPRKDTQCELTNKLRDYMRTFEYQNTLNVDDRRLRLHRPPVPVSAGQQQLMYRIIGEGRCR